MTNNESENSSDRDRHDVAQSSTRGSSMPRPRHGEVTLTVTLGCEDDADLVRQSLLNPTGRREVRTLQLETSPVDTTGNTDQIDDTLLVTSFTQTILQCTYPHMPLALAASRRLPDGMPRRLEATTPLDEDELHVLAEYHARRGRFSADCFNSSDLGRDEYHRQRFHALGDILGEVRVRNILRLTSILGSDDNGHLKI